VALAADGDNLFWIDPDGTLVMGSVKDGKLKQDAILGKGYKTAMIAAGGGFLYIKTDNNLSKHLVKAGVLQQGQVIDPTCTALVMGIDGEKVIWGDPDGASGIGTVVDGRLKSNEFAGKGWKPDLFTAGPLGYFSKYGHKLIKH